VLAVVAVAVFPFAEAVRIIAQSSPQVLYGDQALIELGARRAWHLDQLVGPYSRYDFHHPGPAMFYLLAPWVRLLEPSGPGVYLGAIVINGVALSVSVALLWRRSGAAVALWAAAAIDLFCLCVRVGTLREPWNPYLIVGPMVLFVVLWALAVTGSAGAWLWAAVVGSYEVQTHIATAVFVVAMVVLAALWSLIRAYRSGRLEVPGRWWRHPGRATGLAALLLIWLPPVVELWRDHPNNLTLLWDFFTRSHTTAPFSQALRAAASGVTIIPFGNRDYTLVLQRSHAQLALAGVLFAAATTVAVVLARRRRQPLALAFVAAAALGVVLGVVSLSRSTGAVEFYFAVWLAFVPLALLLAIGVGLLAPVPAPVETPVPVAFANGAAPPDGVPTGSSRIGRHGRPRRTVPVLGALVLVAVGMAAVTVHSDLRMGPVRTITAYPYVDTAKLTAAAQSVLRPGDRSVGFTILTDDDWPDVAGMVLALDRQGRQSTVAPAKWALFFGNERAPGRPVQVQFALSSPGAHTPAATIGPVLATVNGMVLSYQRPAV
jgi:hypothetical protein